MDPFGESIVHCNPDEKQAIFSYSCVAGHCTLSVGGKEVSFDPMSRSYANHVKLVQKAVPSVVLVPRRLGQNGEKVFLIQFSKSRIMGGDTFMDATSKKTRNLEYTIRENAPSQEFFFTHISPSFGRPLDISNLQRSPREVSPQRSALPVSASSMFGRPAYRSELPKAAVSMFGKPVDLRVLHASQEASLRASQPSSLLGVPATPKINQVLSDEQELKPAYYFIRTQYGFVCSGNTGTMGHCSSLGVKAHSWKLIKFQNGFSLRSADGYIYYGQDAVDHKYKIGMNRSEPSKITLHVGSSLLNGSKTTQIQVSGKDQICLLKTEASNNQLSIEGWVGPSGTLNDFVFVPAYQANGKHITFLELNHNSNVFEQDIGSKFPLETNKIATIQRIYGIDKEIFQKQAENVQIILDASTYELFSKFFAHKKAHGNPVERAVYAGLPDVNAFIDRLLKQRPLTFFTSADQTRLRVTPPGTRVPLGMARDWNLVGQVDARGNSIEANIKMTDYLTYEEMELSALINVSTPTHFINSGDRMNMGKYGPPTQYPMQGVFIAAVGPRFEVPGRMEFRHMALLSSQQPSGVLPTDPISKMWLEYYNIRLAPHVTEYEGTDIKLHIPTYKARLAKSILPILLHGNRLARFSNRHATIRLVGFGLGAWAIAGVNQQGHFHEVVEQLIKENTLESTLKIEMLWMGRTGQSDVVLDKSNHPIMLSFHNGNPADPVSPGELLIATYAWDGNSFPGNEYWIGMSHASGDPAAASCSTIQELQNPFINTCLSASNNLSLYA